MDAVGDVQPPEARGAAGDGGLGGAVVHEPERVTAARQQAAPDIGAPRGVGGGRLCVWPRVECGFEILMKMYLNNIMCLREGETIYRYAYALCIYVHIDMIVCATEKMRVEGKE